MTKSPEMSDSVIGVKAQIAAIRATHPENLMARHFDGDYFDTLNRAKRDRLLRIVRSGLENPDSRMGAYAQFDADYKDFEPLLEPMIREYHDIPRQREIAQGHDWSLMATRCHLEDIDPNLMGVSARVRVGRNLENFPLPGAMTKAQRLELEGLMIEVFETLQGRAPFDGQYLSLSPGSPRAIGEAEYQRRVRAHQMFKDMRGDPYLTAAGIASDWPFGRGMYASRAEDFLIWVGEEDHLRIVAMHKGGDLAALLAKLHDGLERLDGLVPAYAHSRRYGYLASCPTNLGTAMRTSLHLPLSRLTGGGKDLTPAKKIASEMSLAVRGAGGEHSNAGPGGLIDVSPRARLGITESGIMRQLYEGARRLWTAEDAA